jgi:hypothetical protein
VIWYGNWGQNNPTDTEGGKNIVRAFLQSIGGSAYFNINMSYSAATAITGNVTWGGETDDNYSQGPRLTDQKVANIVSSALTSGRLPTSANGVYFVLTSSDVAENSGFCNRYCGWHTYGTLGTTPIKYSFVGNAARCLNACAAQAVGPNGNAGVDAMISVIAHELEEATTDPQLSAWYDASGAENADKCAWTFGTSVQIINTDPKTNGAYYNVTMSDGKKYLIQRNLYHSLANGDVCGLAASGGVALQTYPTP